jgi:hypothetical protein
LDRPEFLLCEFEKGLHLFLVTHIQGKSRHLVTGLVKLGGFVLDGMLIVVSQHNPGPVSQQQPGRSQANPAGTARNYRDFTLDTQVLIGPYKFCHSAFSIPS